MKFTSHHFIVFGLKQSATFFISIFIAILLMISTSVFFVNLFQQSGLEAEQTAKEIEELNQRIKSVNALTTLQNDGFDLSQISMALGQLIPNQEDFFSVMIALEKLSAKTSFIIASYDIILDKSKNKTLNSLELNINGLGSETEFVNFLESYRFSGGRLITVENVSYNQPNSTITVSISVYSGKAQIAKNYSSISESEKELMKEILAKTSLELKSSEEKLLEEYPVKSNPF